MNVTVRIRKCTKNCICAKRKLMGKLVKKYNVVHYLYMRDEKSMSGFA